MRRNKLPDTCFSVLPSTGQLIIIKNGENGYYPSEWDTGSREKNREIASDHNEQRGISDIQESAMLAGSMFGWNTPGANPQWYLDNAKYANANILQGHVKDPVMSIYYPINGLLLRYEIVGKRRVYLPMDKLPNELMGMNAQFNPSVKRIVLCLDNDEPGRAASAAIQKELSEYEVIDNPPHSGKDYNDQLQIVKGIRGRVRTRGGDAR